MTPGMLVKRGLLLAITGVSLYLIAPALLEVFGAFDELDDISPLWFAAMIVLQAGSYACIWIVQKIAVREDRWGPVITSQLASNSFGRVVPGGVAAAGAMQYAMLARAGVPAAAAASGMTASSLLVFGTLLALPLLAVPAIITGVAVDPRLARAAVAGAVVFVAMIALGVACVVWDRPLELIGRAAQSVRNRLMRKREPLTDLPAQADPGARHGGAGAGRQVVGGAAGGRRPLGARLPHAARGPLRRRRQSARLARAARLLHRPAAGTLPLTPGGLGFVEAGLTGTLALAGVGAGAAVVATLAYRLVSFWLPIPAGAVAAIIHKRKYGEGSRGGARGGAGRGAAARAGRGVPPPGAVEPAHGR